MTETVLQNEIRPTIQTTKTLVWSSFDDSDIDVINRKLESFASSQGETYASCCFESYDQTEGLLQMRAVRDLKEYADNFPAHLRDMDGFVMLGPSRTGKGHLSRAVCVRILQRFGHLSSRRFDSLFCSVKNCQLIFQEYSDGFRGRLHEETFISKFSWQALLVLEDPFAGGGKFNDWQAGLIYKILELRFQRGLPTGVTSNLRSIEKFRDQFQERNLNRLGKSRIGIDCSWKPYVG